jgi:DNA-binding transcriptional LysR family regulator
MDLNHVAVFAEVVRAGSFTAAAASLGLPKSSVSRTVARLEDDLGVRLLHRTTRALGLTDAGRVYYERVQRALGALSEAASDAAGDTLEPRGLVRMTAPPDMGAMELVGMLARFRSDHPEITVEVALSGRFVDLVEEGFDLAIRGGRLDDSTLVARKIGTTDFALYAAPGYLARRGAPQTLDS